MKKYLFFIIFVLFFGSFAYSQQQQDVQKLIQSLNSDDLKIRTEAAWMLGTISREASPEVFHTIITHLAKALTESKYQDLRETSVRVLQYSISQTLDSDNFEIRTEAAWMLGAISREASPEVFHTIITHLAKALTESKYQDLRETSARVFRYSIGQKALPILPVFIEVLSEKVPEEKKEYWLDRVKHILKTMETFEEKAAPSVPVLIPLISERELASYVYIVLDKIGDQAEPALPYLFKDSVDKGIPEAMLSIIRRFETKKTMPVILQALNNGNILEKKKSIQVLSRLYRELGDDIDLALPGIIETLNEPYTGLSWIGRSTNNLLICLGKKSVPFLIQALNDKRDLVRGRAAEVLRDMDQLSIPAIPALIKALNNNNECKYVKDRLSCALESITKYSLPELEEFLKSEELPTEVRIQIQDIIEKLKKSIPDRIKTLSSTNESALSRGYEARILGQLGKYAVSAVEPLISCLKDQNIGVRKSAAEALGKLKDGRAIKPLISCLKDEEWVVRRNAAKALGELENTEAIKPLISCLKDEEWFVRRNAAEALGKLKNTETVEPLISCLKDEEWQVRRSTAEALGKIKDTKAVESLIFCLKDENCYVRSQAAEALGRLKDARTFDFLMSRLKDQAWEVRKATVWALGELQDARAIEPLISCLKDQDRDVRNTAKDSLKKLGYKEKVIPSESKE